MKAHPCFCQQIFCAIVQAQGVPRVCSRCQRSLAHAASQGFQALSWKNILSGLFYYQAGFPGYILLVRF